jgi:predicted transcriptional regulator
MRSTTKQPKGGDNMATETLTVKEVAEEIGTTARLLRKFLRAETVEAGGKVGEDTPGKGGRYSFTREEADELQERFEAYMAAPAESEDEEDELEETDEVDELEDSEV